MNPRLLEEWTLLKSHYPDVEHREPPERIELTVSLPPDLYNQPQTRLGILVPLAYRATSPDSFFVPIGLQLRGGVALPGGDGSSAGLPGWWMVSFHMLDASGRSTWRPGADFLKGDNLLGYLAAIEQFLVHSCN